MKKIAIIFLLFAICFGCNSNDVKDDIVNEDNSIWIINQYQPLSYDEYYSKERETEIINYQLLQAKDSSLDVYYSSDDNGLFVTTFEKNSMINDFGKDYKEKQYFAKGNYYQFYESEAASDGYWFYYGKTDKADQSTRQLVRVNYKGEEEIIIDKYLDDKYDSVYLIDRDVLLAVRKDTDDISFELYYLNGLHMEEIKTDVNRNAFVEITEQPSSYHIYFEAVNPQYEECLNKLENDKLLLDSLLNKYEIKLIEDKEAYNNHVMVYIIYQEYNIAKIAEFDYDIINKNLSYKPLEKEIEKPDINNTNK